MFYIAKIVVRHHETICIDTEASEAISSSQVAGCVKEQLFESITANENQPTSRASNPMFSVFGGAIVRVDTLRLPGGSEA